MDLLSWQNITLRKRSWELNICNKISTGAILRSKKNNLCSGKGEKDETENEKMFWFKFEDRASGEGLKELDEKKWEFGSSGLRRLDPMAWKELNPEGRSWIKWRRVESRGFMNSVLEYHCDDLPLGENSNLRSSPLFMLWMPTLYCPAWLLLALAASDLVPTGGRCR